MPVTLGDFRGWATFGAGRPSGLGDPRGWARRLGRCLVGGWRVSALRTSQPSVAAASRPSQRGEGIPFQ